MNSTGLKPWVRDPFELIKHAEEHAQPGSDFDRRMALISFDNAIELSIITYLSLHPDQREGQRFEPSDIEGWRKGFHSKVKFFKHYVETILSQSMQVETDIIIYYHRLRNELYHGGGGMVPAETDISGIRATGCGCSPLCSKSTLNHFLPIRLHYRIRLLSLTNLKRSPMNQ
jgi:hypothetical protein